MPDAVAADAGYRHILMMCVVTQRSVMRICGDVLDVTIAELWSDEGCELRSEHGSVRERLPPLLTVGSRGLSVVV